jgi:hypothetical protein
MKPPRGVVSSGGPCIQIPACGKYLWKKRRKTMKRYLKISMIILVALLIAITAHAQHLVTPGIMYDARGAHEFMWGRGGAEGHSGAYIQLNIGVTGYSNISQISVKARHIASNFEVTLTEESKSCIGVWPPDWGIDQVFTAWLRPFDWMTGEWEFVLSYVERWRRKTEKATVPVPRFNFPPIPTGIEIATSLGKKYLVWNRIGDPGIGPGKHVEYRIRHFGRSLPCIDEDIAINANNPGGYQLWSGNRIAFPLPDWESGDRVRIENRVYDDNYSETTGPGPYRFDRGCKDFILP